MCHPFLYLRVLFFSTFLFLGYSSKAQSDIPVFKVSEMSPAEAFDHLQTFLIENEYFVQAMDSKQGFVQIKVLPKDRSMFKRAKRHTVNFFVMPDGKDNSKINLQINTERLDWNGEVNSSSHYYKDEGVLDKNNKVYDELISELKKYYDQLL
ncbi:hypothetical protein [Sphingobacterium faecale]|uniref:DUF4468 domain-containing protein n=1 Tax=Sphingobacterium faecale TaxID=2803775 RepID=A0ABS1R2H0_9SPHI|nr:hypothetical protein [Sphingobacterium faecale]MBL1408232.1 hypothetical protein [Sphingobacterium faecale]